MTLDGFIAGKIEGIAERKIDGLDITVLNLRAKNGHLHTICSDGHKLDYVIGLEVEVWREMVDFKNGIVIVEQRIRYYDALGEYVAKREYHEYP